MSGTNTVLWRCESWSLTEENKRQLQVFHHRSLRKMFNINMFEVEEQRITNAQMLAVQTLKNDPQQV